MGGRSFRPVGVLGLYTETSLHCGAEASLGYVDLPIQREQHTLFPVIPGSSLKGRLKDEGRSPKADGTRHLNDTRLGILFGADEDPKAVVKKGEDPPTLPGSISFGDGVLVAFPIRSSEGPFLWVTSPLALERAFRALGVAADVTEPPGGAAWGLEARAEVLLEEVLLTVEPRPELFGEQGAAHHLLDLLPPDERGFRYTRGEFLKRLLVVGEADLRELLETGTEVVTRIRLNAHGTTGEISKEQIEAEGLEIAEHDRKGNLFVEETVPSQTLFCAVLRARHDVDDLSDALPDVVQIGGGETIGRGVTHLVYRRPDAAEAPTGATSEGGE